METFLQDDWNTNVQHNYHQSKKWPQCLSRSTQMEQPMGKEPKWLWWVSGQSSAEHAGISLRCLGAELSWKDVKSAAVLTWAEWGPHKAVAAPAAEWSSLLLQRRRSWSSSLSPAEKQKRLRLKFLLSRSQPLTLIHTHRHTHTDTHSYRDTAIQCIRCEPRASSRCLKTGGTSVLTPPLLLRLWPPLLGGRLAVKSEPTACLSAPTSTPLRHKIPLIKMHLLWHHETPLLFPLPLFSSTPFFSACTSGLSLSTP